MRCYPAMFLFCLVKIINLFFSISSKLCLHISIWHWWTGSQDFGNSIRVFSSEAALRIRWPKYWSFSFSITASNEHPGLISFRMDWLDLLATKGLSRVFSSTTVWKHHFFSAQPLHSVLTFVCDYWKNHSFDYRDLCQQSDVSAF